MNHCVHVSLALVALTLLVAVTGDAAEPATPVARPADPVVSPGPGGAYAVAVAGLAGGPVLAGDSVLFTVGDVARERLFSVGQAFRGGKRRVVYAPPAKRPGSAALVAASSRRVVLFRDRSSRAQACEVGGECTNPSGELIAGPPGARLKRLFGATERLKASRSCRRRIAQLAGEVSVSRHRIAYARRVRCLSPRRRGRSQVVVRDLRTGAVRVVRRGPAEGVELAGSFLAFERFSRKKGEITVVVDLRSGRTAYQASTADARWSLGPDGKLAVAKFKRSLVGRLGWYSPRSPRLHRLPDRVAVFSASPLIYARGRIAYVRSYDPVRGATLAVTDLRGRARVHARFGESEELDAFTFDGTRLAFAHTPYRPDQGRADDGLASTCLADQFLVPAAATVIEVHPVAEPGRMAAGQLPSALPYRSPAGERPECPARH